MKIYGKKLALSKLDGFYSTGRMPHAILITGEEGVGKRTLADYAAMLMLCEKGGSRPCGSCKECMRIEEHIHPDVVYPLREMNGGKYNVKETVEFINQCVKLPNDTDYRICIFEQADTMNESCQNALLKFIEEPREFNRFIFTASDKSRIIETILSRVTEIKTEAADKEACISALSANEIERAEAEKLFGIFGGNIGRCLAAHEDEDALILFTTAEKIAEAVTVGKEYDCMKHFASVKTREDLATLLKNLSDIFGNAAALYTSGKTYGFTSPVSAQISERMNLKKINNIYETVIGLLKSMDLNPNVQLAAAGCCAKMFNAAEKTAERR